MSSKVSPSLLCSEAGHAGALPIRRRQPAAAETVFRRRRNRKPASQPQPVGIGEQIGLDHGRGGLQALRLWRRPEHGQRRHPGRQLSSH